MRTEVIVTCITGMVVGASIFFFSGSEEVVYADTPTEVVLEDDSDGSSLPAQGVVIGKSITSDKRSSFFPEMGECIIYRAFLVDTVLEKGAAIAS